MPCLLGEMECDGTCAPTTTPGREAPCRVSTQRATSRRDEPRPPRGAGRFARVRLTTELATSATVTAGGLTRTHYSRIWIQVKKSCPRPSQPGTKVVSMEKREMPSESTGSTMGMGK